MPNALPSFFPDVHHILDGRTLITEYPNGSGETRELESAELPKILTEVFDIELSEPDASALVQGSWPA